MDGTLGEIRLFGGNFAPRGWAYCAGQILAISTNTALFSILGTVYGGDGRTTFGLPDLRGRIPIGQGTGPGLSPNVLGQRSGVESEALTLNQLPVHNHTATFTPGGGGSASAKVDIPVSASGNVSNEVDSGNSYLAMQGVVPDIYAEDNSGTAYLAPIEAPVTGGGGGGTVTLGIAGGSSPVSIMQPFGVLNYIICTQGLFPYRN